MLILFKECSKLLTIELFTLNLKKENKYHSAIISGCITPVRNAPFFSLHLGFSFLSLLPVAQLGVTSQSPPSFGERT